MLICDFSVSVGDEKTLGKYVSSGELYSSCIDIPESSHCRDVLIPFHPNRALLTDLTCTFPSLH